MYIVYIDNVHFFLFLGFRDRGIKASMYNREFVSCVLSLIAQYCPDVNLLYMYLLNYVVHVNGGR